MRNLRCSRPRRQGQSWRAIGDVTILPSIVPDDFACSHTVELGTYMQCLAPQLRPVGTQDVPAGLANVRPLQSCIKLKCRSNSRPVYYWRAERLGVWRVCEGYSERSIALDARRVP